MNIPFTLLLTVSLMLLGNTLSFAEKTLQDALQQQLSCNSSQTPSSTEGQPIVTRKNFCLTSVYQLSGQKPFWVSAEGPTGKADVLLHVFAHADSEGLEPKNYDVENLKSIWDKKEPSALAKLDIMLTYSTVKYLHDIKFGNIAPYSYDPVLFHEAGNVRYNPAETMRELLQAEDMRAFLSSLAPQNRYYKGLKESLRLYKKMTGIHWNSIENGPSIKPGTTDERLPRIRHNLEVLLDGKDMQIPGKDEDSIFYDESLQKDIRLFQMLHGLYVDGIIGAETLAELNVSPEKRIEKILVNMARWRWIDHLLGTNYVLVNIANFTLEGYREGRLDLGLPVIVGTLQQQTPVFSNAIQYVEFNPYWNVPTSIAVKEELPRLRKDPEALVKRSIRLYSSWQEKASELDSTKIDWQQISKAEMAGFKLRQDPGPGNALGRFKFMFPNQYSVYIHDTPGKNLFNEPRRFFSHGCIRVSQPDLFAGFVLHNTKGDWDKGAIDGAAASGVNKIVRLEKAIPIHITYQTVWLDNDSRIHFSKDIYNRDEKLASALFKR